MKSYKPSKTPEALYPTAQQARSGMFTRAGAILLAAVASAGALSGCGGEKPPEIVGDIAAPTVTTTTAETQPMTPGEALVEIDGALTVSPEDETDYQGGITTTTATATESMVLPQGTFVVTDSTEPVLLPTGSVCAESTDEVTTPVTERPTTTVGTYYIPDEDETTSAETHVTTAGDPVVVE